MVSGQRLLLENVDVEITEAVRAALVEGDLSRAVNAPALSGEAMRKIRPLMSLAELKAEYKGDEPDRLGNEKNYAKYQERVATLRDAIGRSERNIEALRREISNIR